MSIIAFGVGGRRTSSMSAASSSRRRESTNPPTNTSESIGRMHLFAEKIILKFINENAEKQVSSFVTTFYICFH
jgi:hypothetical protein